MKARCRENTERKKGMMKGKINLTALAVVVLSLCANGITVDFTKEKGHIRRLNGLCNTAKIGNSMHAKNDQLPRIKELEIPCTRYHDAALFDAGYALVDVSRIFPLFHLDADDPRNYIFKPTDDYVMRTLETGSAIEFKFGESIEHSKNRYRVNPPADLKKYADICLHIVRHYNAGWANGYKLNIRRWSVWEEPNNEQILHCPDGSNLETYCRLYEAIVKAVKGEFPDLEVGGPVDMYNLPFRRGFVQYCRDHSLPLDFVMFTDYCRDPEDMFARFVETREMVDELGFKGAKLAAGEWHYGPTDFEDLNNDPKVARATAADLKGADAGVYTASVLARMQDSPADDLFFYAPASGAWGFFVPGGMNANWYAFKAFQMMAAKGQAVRVDAPSFLTRGRYMLASKHDGKGWLMFCNFKRSDDVYLEVKGGVPVSVRRLDQETMLEEVSAWDWNAKRSVLWLKPPLGSTSTLWLVECKLD